MFRVNRSLQFQEVIGRFVPEELPKLVRFPRMLTARSMKSLSPSPSLSNSNTSVGIRSRARGLRRGDHAPQQRAARESLICGLTKRSAFVSPLSPSSTASDLHHFLARRKKSAKISWLPISALYQVNLDWLRPKWTLILLHFAHRLQSTAEM